MKKFFEKKYFRISVVLWLAICFALFVGAARELFDVGILQVRTVRTLYPSTSVQVTSPISHEYTRTKALTSANWTAGTGFTITVADISLYDVFTVDLTGTTGICSASIGPTDTSGTTVIVPTPTAAIDGKKFSVVKIDSGTTDVFVWASGLPVRNASGITNYTTMDAQGDSVTLSPDYSSGVSYYVVGSVIN